MAREDLIQLRGGDAATWTSVNPVLALKEPGLETDTGKLKFGDGSTAWNSLAYFSGSSNTLQQVIAADNVATTKPVFQGNIQVGDTSEAIVELGDQGSQIETDGSEMIFNHEASGYVVNKNGTGCSIVSTGTGWDASTNTKANTDTGVLDVEWRCTVAGTVDFGAGNIDFAVGDILSNDGSVYYKKVNNNQSGGSTAPAFYQNRIDIPKETADTIDDDFNLNQLDSKWNIESGVVGAVNLMAESISEDEAIIDMFSDQNGLLVQVAENKDFSISQDFTLADGESVIACMSVPMQLTQTLPDLLRAGISIGDGSGAQDNNYFALALVSRDDTWWFTREVNGVQAGGLGDGTDEPFVLGQKIYYRILRKGTTYQGFFSSDGSTWIQSNYPTEILFGSTKLYLFANSEDTQANSPLGIVKFDWIRKANADVIPWDNQPTAPPVIIGSSTNGDNGSAVINTNTPIAQADLIPANFSIAYTDNGDTATGMTLTTITNLDGSAISGDTDQFLVNYTVTGTSDGLATYVITANNLDDTFGNGAATTTSRVLPLYDTSDMYYWARGQGDNDSSAPYTKTDTNQSVVLTSNGTVEPTLNGDLWEFPTTSGFKSTETAILNAFNASNRECQLHYTVKFPTASGSNRGVVFSDNTANKYYNFFYTFSGEFNIAIGSTGSTLILNTNINVIANKEYVCSFNFYIEGGISKMDAYLSDGISDLYTLKGQVLTAYPSISSNGYYWAMREQTGGVKTYYNSSIPECIIKLSNGKFNEIRKSLKLKL